MGPAAIRPPPRKRVRKRKRRAVSSSSSSSSSSDSDSNEETQPKQPPISKPVIPQPEESSSSSEASSSSSSSESEPESEPEEVVPVVTPVPGTRKSAAEPKPRQIPRHNSPSPPPVEIPSFIHSADPTSKESEEQLMKARFRKFWMASVADGFKDDLEEIRKEPNLGPSRLSVLIDSLASGADVFSSSREKQGVNEIEVILE